MQHLRVLGIDSSLTGTGLCRVDMDLHVDERYVDKPVTRAWSAILATFSAPKPTKDKTFRAMSRRITDLLKQIETAFEDVDLICMESLAYGAKGASAYVLPWLWGDIVHMAEKHDIEFIVAGTSQIKKYATSRGNADKDQVLAAAINRFPDFKITNNNEADATIACAIGCRYLGHPIDQMPQAHYVDVMKKIGVAA